MSGQFFLISSDSRDSPDIVSENAVARITGVDTAGVEPAERKVFDRQIEEWGVTLEPYEIYARRPSIMHAVIGMWDGLGSSGLLDRKLTTLVNRRVAALNGCVF